jgi:hypothetical protein
MFDITSFIDPTSLISPLVTVMCYTGVMGYECRVQPECLGVAKAYSCYQRNFGDIHTPEYMKAIKQGHNIRARIKNPGVFKKEKDIWEIF